MRFCPECGVNLVLDAKFCIECGLKLDTYIKQDSNVNEKLSNVQISSDIARTFQSMERMLKKGDFLQEVYKN